MTGINAIRGLSGLVFLLGLTLLSLNAAGVLEGRAQVSGQPLVLVAEVKGVIGPANTHHVANAIGEAQQRGAAAVVLQINTPGGLVTSMRDMISNILASPVPVVGYVAPSGAQAASAGTYLLYATSIAAMAPGTNVGSATPVQLGGGSPLPGRSPLSPSSDENDSGNGSSENDNRKNSAEEPADPAKAKALNDAIAFIRSLAELHGRNADWAEKAVREAANISASEALNKNVIDAVAESLEDLLEQIDGRTVKAGSETRTLSTANAQVEKVEPSLMTEILGIIGDPNIALILMMIGIYGLIFELSNPGTIGPGVIGIICLILALYALNQLPLNYAGLALMILGIGFMVAEALTPTFGILAVGGIVAFVIGAAMLIDTDIPEYQIAWEVIGGIALVSALIIVFVVGYLVRAHMRPIRSGREHLVGLHGHVLEWTNGQGHIWLDGERWAARGPASLAGGDRVTVISFDGLTLEIAAAEQHDDSSAPAVEKG